MLNYKQLFYFWSIARTGGVSRAAESLNVTPQTISGQLGELERSLGVKLFKREGRRLDITQAGELALTYAEEIFQVGSALETLLRQQPTTDRILFRVGIVDAVPKSIAYQLLSATFELAEPVLLICQEDKAERLLGELAIHKLDLVITDRSLPRELDVKGYSHELGRSSVTFCAASGLADSFKEDFPRSLHGAPMLMPGEGTSLRGVIVHWLLNNKIQPHVVGEFADTALLKAFGQAGRGVFPVPSVIADEVVRRYGVAVVGRVEDAMVSFFAITQERRLKHPAALAVSQLAKNCLFRAEAANDTSA